MKTVTINVSEQVYLAYQQFAKKRGRKTSELIREAMAEYWERKIRRTTTLRDFQPSVAGDVYDPFLDRDNLQGEMIGDKYAIDRD